jgi:hypothetical protein
MERLLVTAPHTSLQNCSLSTGQTTCVQEATDNANRTSGMHAVSVLSKNKRAYLENWKADRKKERQLRAEDLSVLLNAKAYRERHGMRFVVNGELRREFLEKKQVHEIQRVAALQQSVDTAPCRDAIMLVKYWTSIASTTLFEKLKMRLAQDDDLKRCDFGLNYPFNLNMNDPNAETVLHKLQAVIDEGDVITPAHLTQLRKAFQSNFNEKLEAASRTGLNKEEAVDEMREIAHKLGPGESAAYFYTSGIAEGNQHVETLLLHRAEGTGKIFFVNLIPFNVENERKIMQGDLKDEALFTSDLTPFVAQKASDRSSRRLFCPQATKEECASLGIAFAKEMMKNGAEQLKNFTLTLIVGKAQFFLLSPQVLRYSQSQLYLRLMHAMVESTDSSVIVKHNGKEYKVLTLNGMLAHGGTIAFPDKVNIEEFRARWLAGFEAAMPRRSAMDLTNEKTMGTENQYLAYMATRNRDRIIQLQAASGL